METTKTTNPKDFSYHFNKYFEGCQAITAKHNRQSIASFNKTSGKDPLPENFHDRPWKYETGKKYIKVIHESSAHSFIEIETGNVLKAASWKTPAKHARGNIYDEWNGLKTMGPYGPAYLR